MSRQSTKAITETILESAELMRINIQALYCMLSQTKKVSHNQVIKSIYFYFLFRETAEQHKEVGASY